MGWQLWVSRCRVVALLVPCCCSCAAHRKCARLTLVCVVEAGGVGRWVVRWEVSRRGGDLGVVYSGMGEAGWLVLYGEWCFVVCGGWWLVCGWFVVSGMYV